MQISIIVAMDENRAIGVDNRLPWRLRTDLQRFKQLTMGHHLILGRQTYASIGRPLPGRKMLILSRDPNFQAAGCQTAGSLEQALEIARQNGETEVFIGGGAAVYALAWPHATRLYLTRVQAALAADVFFPAFDLCEWQLLSTEFHPADPDNQFSFTFSVYQR